MQQREWLKVEESSVIPYNAKSRDDSAALWDSSIRCCMNACSLVAQTKVSLRKINIVCPMNASSLVAQTKVSLRKNNIVCSMNACSHLTQTKISLKGTATLMITMFYMKDLYKPWNLIPVSSKLVEKCGSCGRLNICKWTVIEAAIL